jgi:hypothetical protein
MGIARSIRHLCTGRRALRQCFPPPALAAVEAAVRRGETEHRGQLYVAIECALGPAALWADLPPRERAVELFSSLGVWDTAENSGVLIYILLADRDVEIVADRGYLGSIDDAGWLAACQLMEDLFRNGRFEAGLLDGVARVSALMAGAFPASEDADGNELPDAPVII